MKKQNILLAIVVLLLSVSSCGTNEPIEEPVEGVTKGVWTSTYTTGDENSTIKIVVNNFDKTGSVEIEMFIADEDEWGYSLDEGTYKFDDFSKEGNNETISLSELSCGLFWILFRDYDNSTNVIKDWQEGLSEGINQTFTEEMLTEEETGEQKRLEEFMKGFKATRLSMNFIDKEDRTKIAECYNIGLEEDDLEIKAYNSTSEREMESGWQVFWGDSSEAEEDAEEEKTQYASCVPLGCDENHIAIGDRSTYQWYYCDCFGVESIAREDRTCFSNIDVAEAVGYYKAWDCE